MPPMLFSPSLMKRPARFFLLWMALGFSATLYANDSQNVYREAEDTGAANHADRIPDESSDLGQKRTYKAVKGSAQLPYEVRQAVQRYPVTLFVSQDCKALCDRAALFLKSSYIPYQEVSLTTQEDFDDFHARTRLALPPIVPSLLVGHKARQGFIKNEWTDLLLAAGYPLGQ